MILRGIAAVVLLPVVVIVVVLVRQGDRVLAAYDQLVPMSCPRPSEQALTLLDQAWMLIAGILVGLTLTFWVWN